MSRQTPGGAGERGSGTLLVVGCLLLFSVLAGIALVLSGYIAAQHAAADAADLTALAGASRHDRGSDACSAARTVALANGVTLLSCTLSGDSLDFVIRVTVAKRVGSPAGLPSSVMASAEAGRLSGG